MQFFLALLHELTKYVGLLFIGQFLVFVLSFGRHEGNPVYRFFRFLTSPINRVVRRITPKAVVDKHVPLVSFLLVFWIWVVLIFVRRGLIVQGGA